MNIQQEMSRIMDELAIADRETEDAKARGKMATPEYRERRRKWEERKHQKQQAAKMQEVAYAQD